MKKTKVEEIKAYEKKLKDIVSSLLKENTGRHILDSGGIGGRNWERNQDRNFEEEPVCELHVKGDEETKEIKELWVTYNLYWFLINFCYLDEETEKINAEFTEFSNSEEMKEESWIDCLETFLKNKKAKIYSEDYTYNQGGECILSQDIVYQIADIDGIDFTAIQIHNGCDARGGFTHPYFFKSTDGFATGMSFVTASCSGYSPEMSVEKGDMFDMSECYCRNIFDSYDGCYSWEYQGERHKERVDFFDIFEFDGEDEDGNCVRCKDCGSKVDFFVMEGY
jgi:hypothetical protein